MKPIKLTPEQVARKALLVARLRELEPGVNAALDALNAALVDYNEAAEDARALCEEVHDDTFSAMRERSRIWKESLNGRRAYSFASVWVLLVSRPFSFEAVRQIRRADFAALLEALPNEPVKKVRSR
jgi:outer membrane PBP1 activator LpoA protein